MAVYVDEPKWRLGRMIMCHMIADSEAELLEMAAAIGVDRRWVQRTRHLHFDICKTKRAAAIRRGAIAITSRELVRVSRRRQAGATVRQHGEPRGISPPDPTRP